MSEPTAEPAVPPEYRIEELAHRSGATVRTIRGYQDRGLLPRPERRGRANVYGAEHLARLQQISALLERGYTLSSIKELLEAWDAGRDLGGVLGLVAEVEGPWTDEKAARISRAELADRFGGAPDQAAIAEAVELGILEPDYDCPDAYVVPSPRELSVAAELHAAGVPLLAIAEHVREVRGQIEHIAVRFLDFTTEHVFQQYLDHPPTDAEAQEAAFLIRRFRPLAQQTIDAELARAMRAVATRYLHHHLDQFGPLPRPDTPRPGGSLRPTTAHPHTRRPDETQPPPTTRPAPEPTGPPSAQYVTGSGPRPGAATGSGDSGSTEVRTGSGSEGRTRSQPTAGGPGERDGWQQPQGDQAEVTLPAEIVRVVRELVGDANVSTFIAGAAEREVWARRMDRLAIPEAPPSEPGG
ncbi:MerR family transcriptional regulator [Streptomyces sp. 71268]|nr:MerR family transcriptional regulator [Streptomyces sp. 71268]WEV26605.1 MerR family transcriptional regulator [Streptomyces sp. 71268]